MAPLPPRSAAYGVSFSAMYDVVAQLLSTNVNKFWNLNNRSLRPLSWQTYYKHRLNLSSAIIMSYVLCQKVGVSLFSKCPCQQCC